MPPSHIAIVQRNHSSEDEARSLKERSYSIGNLRFDAFPIVPLLVSPRRRGVHPRLLVRGFS